MKLPARSPPSFARAWLRAASGLVAAVLFVAAPAWAQERGFRVHRYEGTTAGSWQFLVDRPWYSGERYAAAGLTFDYAYRPLVPRIAGATPIVLHALVGHLDVAGSMFDRVLLSASLPVTLRELGSVDPLTQVGPLQSYGLGDPRGSVMVRLFGQSERDAFSAHLGGDVWVPIGAAATHQGDSGFRLLPRVVLAGAFGAGRWALDLGFLFRNYASLGPPALGMTAASEVRGGLSIGARLADERLSIGPEAQFAMQMVGDNALTNNGMNLELLIGAQYLIADMILVGVAAGSALFGAAGSPDARAMVRVAWAPRHRLEPEKPPEVGDDEDVEWQDDTFAAEAGPVDAGVLHTDATGNLVNAEGKRVDPKGHLVNAEGKRVDAEGNRVDDKGRRIDAEGRRVDAEGKPLPPRSRDAAKNDADGDGVSDLADRCPYEPETKNGVNDADGCPEFEMEKGSTLARVLAPNANPPPPTVASPGVAAAKTIDGGAPLAPVDAGVAPELAAVAPSAPLGSADSDGDGIIDALDRCPATPEDVDEFEDEDGCPELDNDGDGLSDKADTCAMEAETKNGVDDGDGCPDVAPDTDADKDGVADGIDRCPYEPESDDGVRDDDGCPEYVQPDQVSLANILAEPSAPEPAAVATKPATPGAPPVEAPKTPAFGSADSDKDGVIDDADRCPVTPEDKDNFEDEDGCPELDNDDDGVPDAKDQCADVAETVNGFKDDDGCADEQPDTDGDGVAYEPDRCPLEPGNAADGCPHTPLPPLALPGFPGLPEAAKGPAPEVKTPEPAKPVEEPVSNTFSTADYDKDGLPDEVDACPSTAEDKDRFEDEDGCPEPDNDRDGVPDDDDKCPFAAESINGIKDTDGCPDSGASVVTIQAGAVVIDGIIQFKLASATLQASATPLLKQVAAKLKAASTLSIEIQGHTDDRGNAVKNIELSKRRAQTIRTFLVKAGVSGDRLIANGYGPTRPRASNQTAAGREKNRRVEFLILGEAK